MALFNESRLRTISRDNISQKDRLFSESRKTSIYDIFLSHSYLDRDVVEGLFIELTKAGFKVYVDWIVDPQLNRTQVTKETAELIRKRMISSKSLLLAMSTNAELSKWIPWELGFVDGHTHACALVPIEKGLKETSSFSRSEYLKLYPYISREFGSLGTDLYAIESGDRYVNLRGLILEKKQPMYQDFLLF